jgi:hypothetical protein
MQAARLRVVLAAVLLWLVIPEAVLADNCGSLSALPTPHGLPTEQMIPPTPHEGLLPAYAMVMRAAWESVLAGRYTMQSNYKRWTAIPVCSVFQAQQELALGGSITLQFICVIRATRDHPRKPRQN